jgi:hypothetical protein
VADSDEDSSPNSKNNNVIGAVKIISHYIKNQGNAWKIIEN